MKELIQLFEEEGEEKGEKFTRYDDGKVVRVLWLSSCETSGSIDEIRNNRESYSDLFSYFSPNADAYVLSDLGEETRVNFYRIRLN